MKNLFLFMAITLVGLGGCSEKRSQPLAIDNSLTQEEIAAGVLSPEVMWKMGRVGLASLSPDASRLLYTVTWYNMQENRGVTAIYVRDAASGEVAQLTDFSSNNSDPKWNADGSKIYFLSDRSGSSQIWEMAADGQNPRQLSKLDKDIEGFGVNPAGDKVFYVQGVQVADRKSSDIHPDMDESKARVYDDLMCRHWDRWDEGEYRHIFIAELTSGGIGKGVDIIGEGAEWDTPLAPYFDMSEIAWAPDGTRLAYTCKPLTGAKYAVSTDSDIFVYDTETGATTNICKGLTPISGHDAAAKTELPFVGYDKYPVFSPDGTKIAFRSQRRAGNEADKERLMVWNSETGLVKELTKNFDYNATNVIWDGSEALWFLAPMEATHQLCRVDMNGNVSVLTRGDHDINAVSIANGKAVADICTISSPSELYEIDLKDGAITQLTFINQPILDKIRLGKVEKRWVETTDGKQMLTWVILPPDAALLRRRSAKRRIAILELPLELPAHGRQRLHRRRPQPPGRAFVRTGVARPDLGRLLGPEYPRLPLGYRRRRQGALGGQGPPGLRRRFVRRLFGLFPGRTPRRTLQGFHLPLRYLRLRSHVRIDRGAFLPEQRLRRPLLGQAERDGHAYLC